MVRRKSNGNLGFITYIKRHWFKYMLVVPGLIALIVFSYGPMYGILLAFKDFKMSKGIIGSPWVGLEHFNNLFNDPYFKRVVSNTVIINLMGISISFPFVIFLALMLNDLKHNGFKRTMQTFVYLPNFISWVVYGGLITIFLSPSEGVIKYIVKFFGVDNPESVNLLFNNNAFRWVLVFSGLIKGAGFSTIVYLAGLAGVNPELYESAKIDGANRFHLNWYINLPRILPSIAVLFILSIAGIFGSNFDQVFNLYNARVYESGDVISTYLYRTGLLEGKYEKATALGLLFSLVGLATVLITNSIIKRLNVTGIL